MKEIAWDGYLFTQPDSALLESLNEYTWENEDVPQMISGQLVGKFLQSIIFLNQVDDKI